GVDGARVERILELANIAANKNTVPGDKSAFIPGGLRVGTPAMTTRGFKESDFEQVAEFIHQGVQITNDICKKDFKEYVGEDGSSEPVINELKHKVIDFVKKFPTIGFEESEMKYA
ncbi:8749_t:CDS:2, partial [Racocetra fulgida]